MHFVVAVIGGDYEGQLEPFGNEYEVDEHEEECWNCCGEKPEEGKDPCDQCEGTGTIMSTSNGDAQWDWYSLGGRWANTLKLKQSAIDDGDYGEEEWVDEAMVKDIDWLGMIEKVKSVRRKTWDEIQKNNNKDDRGLALSWNYKEGMTKDEFINKDWGISPYTILHDGEWYDLTEKDKDKQFMDLIKTLDPETEITIVDCHM